MHNRTSRTPPKADTARRGDWYRQPVVWLGMAIFTASIAGCIWMIVLGIRHQDPAIQVQGRSILSVPVERQRAPEERPPASPQP